MGVIIFGVIILVIIIRLSSRNKAKNENQSNNEEQYKDVKIDTRNTTVTSPKYSREEEEVGITSNMGKNEIKAKIILEYRKWNGRVGNSNPEIRKKAEEKILILAKLRQKYK